MIVNTNLILIFECINIFNTFNNYYNNIIIFLIINNLIISAILFLFNLFIRFHQTLHKFSFFNHVTAN